MQFPSSYDIMIYRRKIIRNRREIMYKLQTSLFYNIDLLIQSSNFHRKYYLIFKALDLSDFKNLNSSVGCTGYSRHAILRAFIVKHLERINSVPALIEFLDAHPILIEMCGFENGLPDASQFYRFLSSTKHSTLENLFYSVNKELIDKNIISLQHFIIDSKPVMAPTKHNNFKNPNRNTRNKLKKCNRNPHASLSYYSYQSINGKKDNYIFFWGYRTHVIISREGIPLVELTLPNSVSDAEVAKLLIKKLKRIYRFKKNSVFIADAAYDQRELFNFIYDQMNSLAFFPINPRNTQQPKTLGSHGNPLCPARIEMKSNGSWTENLRTRLKFRCPIKTHSKVAKKFLYHCPVNHPSFSTGKSYGCTKYLDVTHDHRSRIPRDSAFFKETFSLRTEVERYFARLGDTEFEQTTHYKIRSIKNQLTIAHLSMSLVAYAAAILINQPDKIRSYRYFAHDSTLPISA